MRTTAPLLLLALALPCGVAGATPPAPSLQGLTVVRDADSGELRAPTPVELRALRRQSTSTLRPPPLTGVTGSRGERSITLGERGLVYSVVQRGADGKPVHRCVDSAHAATHVLEQSDTAAGAPRHDHR
jgi:hypothetical protein